MSVSMCLFDFGHSIWQINIFFTDGWNKFQEQPEQNANELANANDAFFFLKLTLMKFAASRQVS